MVLKQTPLNAVHKELKAKMVDFGGWEMPVQYAGIIEEHTAVRTRSGLFDVSHMGEIWVKGPDSLKFLQKMVSNDVSKLKTGKIQYVFMCYENGGVVDDLLIYKMAEDDYLLVVNASNTDKDYQWIMDHKEGDIEIINDSDITAQLAIQGPKAGEILQEITDIDLSTIKFYSWAYGKVDGVECLISRTGYTGEDGFEIYFAHDKAVQLWEKLLAVGKDNIVPVGLGARDTLRFEAGLPLYGHELSESITPLEAGLGRFVVLGKDDFIGLDALKKQDQEGLARKVAGFEMIDRGIARAEFKVFADDKEIGFVTTGSPAPSLDKYLGNALIDVDYTQVGQELFIDIRGKKRKAAVIATPFYKRGR